MFKFLILLIRIALPFVLNLLLFLWIYEINIEKEFGLTNSLFYVGMISMLYGLGTIFLLPRSNYLYRLKPRNTAINLALSEQHIKNYHQGKKINFPTIFVTSTQIKLIYIVLGVLFCISSAIVYYI